MCSRVEVAQRGAQQVAVRAVGRDDGQLEPARAHAARQRRRQPRHAPRLRAVRARLLCGQHTTSLSGLFGFDYISTTRYYNKHQYFIYILIARCVEFDDES